jgi:hypothetical protein
VYIYINYSEAADKEEFDLAIKNTALAVSAAAGFAAALYSFYRYTCVCVRVSE